jgi:hypothetical protein
VEVLYDCTIQATEQHVGAQHIFRHLNTRGAGDLYVIFVSVADSLDPRRRKQVEAICAVDDGADDIRLLGLRTTRPCRQFLCVLKPAKRIRLPEVDAWTQPIEIVVAELNCSPESKRCPTDRSHPWYPRTNDAVRLCNR